MKNASLEPLQAIYANFGSGKVNIPFGKAVGRMLSQIQQFISPDSKMDNGLNNPYWRLSDKVSSIMASVFSPVLFSVA
jgi:hypothetical protein